MAPGIFTSGMARDIPGMVKPSSLGFFEVSMGAAAAGRSATADAALTEDAESETLRRAPAQQ